MNCAAQGFMTGRGPGSTEAVTHFAAALDLEMEAIALLPEHADTTWSSILHRSAAWMAIHSRQFTKAETLTADGLNNNPPADIEAELRDLLRQIPQYEKRKPAGSNEKLARARTKSKGANK